MHICPLRLPYMTASRLQTEELLTFQRARNPIAPPPKAFKLEGTLNRACPIVVATRHLQRPLAWSGVHGHAD